MSKRLAFIYICVLRRFTVVFVLWIRRVRVWTVTPAVKTRVSRGLPHRLLDNSGTLSLLPLDLLPVQPPPKQYGPTS